MITNYNYVIITIHMFFSVSPSAVVSLELLENKLISEKETFGCIDSYTAGFT